ncbi:hypothetical protein [Marinospirillum alkaliphilum]|uniref:hypothetical protein n=1 Tax=Marinospirillum alkaliphilum TaxID=148454 RepID=UPI000930E3DA|nr:hypothetical protein [Marinospirillum alkaliphilum]
MKPRISVITLGVDEWMAQAEVAGAVVVKLPHETFWGDISRILTGICGKWSGIPCFCLIIHAWI